LSVLAGLAAVAKQVAKRSATLCLHLLVCGVRAHGRNSSLAHATVKRTSAVVCRVQEARKRCTATALQSHIIREQAERCNDRLDGTSSAGVGCGVCALVSQ
jgi:hypothetical protein